MQSRHLKLYILEGAATAALLFYMALFGQSTLSAQESAGGLAKELTKVIQDHIRPVENNPVHSILVYAKKGPAEYYEGLGMADGKNQKVSKNFQFKIASVTKTFTATLILQMAEEGLLQLDHPVYQYVEDYDFVKIDSIHILNGQVQGRDITIRQLLQHRSGLADLFFDKFDEFMAHWDEDRRKQWTAEKLFQYFYTANLHHLAHFKPGEGFHYSDVNYFLLGLIIEKLSNQSLAQQYRTRILDPLGMTNSYMEYYEPARGNQWIAHSFMDKDNITLSSNSSSDWAGGGIVSTTKDLATFIEALLAGKLFKNHRTLDMMKKTLPTGNPDYEYGMGLMRYTINGKTYFGHSGFWGVYMLASPDDDTTLCFSINQVIPPYSIRAFRNKLLEIL